MTITAWEAGVVVARRPRPANARDALVGAARCRYQLPADDITAVLDRYAPGLKPEHRWHFLDALAALADRYDLLDVASTDEARDALDELREGPWGDDVLCEALTRRDETSAEIDDMIREAQ